MMEYSWNKIDDEITYGIWWDESCIEFQGQQVSPVRVCCYKTVVLASRNTDSEEENSRGGYVPVLYWKKRDEET